MTEELLLDCFNSLAMTLEELDDELIELLDVLAGSASLLLDEGRFPLEAGMTYADGDASSEHAAK